MRAAHAQRCGSSSALQPPPSAWIRATLAVRRRPSTLTAVRSLVSYGSTPPGNWGPNAGFPLTVLAGPQQGANLANVPLSYPTEDYYPAPCAYSPGATMSYSSLLDIVSGLLPNQ